MSKFLYVYGKVKQAHLVEAASWFLRTFPDPHNENQKTFALSSVLSLYPADSPVMAEAWVLGLSWMVWLVVVL